MKKTKRFAAMAAAIAVCAGVTTYLPQDIFSGNVMSASAVEKAELSSLEIYGEAITDFQFHVNEDILNSILSVKNLHACIYDIYDEEYLNTPINDTDFIFDLSAVDTSTPGIYTVTASYAPDESISTTFYIGIVTLEMEIYGESFTDFQFCVNDDILDNILSDNKLYAHIYDSYGEEYLFEPINDTDYIFDLSAVDSSTPGVYPVTVAYAPDDTISTVFDIEIIALQEETESSKMEIYSEYDKGFQFHVNDDILNCILSDNMLYANIYDTDGTAILQDAPLNDTDFIFDLSAVDTSTPGTYPVTVSYAYDDSISTTFNIGIVPWQMEIHGEGFTDFQFHVNDDILDKLTSPNTTLHAHIYDIYGEKYLSNEPLNDTDFIFDLSAVDISTAGVYPVTVSYAFDDSISTTFDIELFAWEMEICGENESDFTFHVNDDILERILSDNNLYARIYDEHGVEYIHNVHLNDTDFIFDLSAVDTSTAGVYPVTVTYTHDESITTTFDIEIVEWQLEIYSENDADFRFHVNDDILDKLTYEKALYAHINDIYGNEWYHMSLNVDDFIFDLSAVDTSTAGVYPVTVGYAYDESITTTFDIEIVEWQMEIYSKNDADFRFHVNDDILEKILSNKNLYSHIYDEHGVEYIHNAHLNDTDFIFDLSAVDTSTAGIYPVTVAYAYDESISTTFDIEIVEWQMEIYSENDNDFRFHVNDDIIEKLAYDNTLQVHIFDIYGSEIYHSAPLRVENFIFNLSAVDTSTAGTYPVTVALAHDESITTTFDIEIIDWQMEIYSENDTDFRFHVNDDILDKLAFENTLYARIFDIYDEEYYNGPLNVDDFIFNLSAVDTSTAGTYPVTVAYALDESICTTFDIEIVEWQLEIQSKNDNDFRFHVNDDILDKLTYEKALYAHIYDIYGDEQYYIPLNVDDFIFNLSAVDTSTAGIYPVTVAYALDESISTTFDITIVGFEEIGTPDDKSTLLGDANCDGKITMADAAAIFQNLGNPDKYQLSEQGKKNADVEGNKNGITVDDAITIMKYQAGLIEKL